MHLESGYFRVTPNNSLEATICDPTGTTQTYTVEMTKGSDGSVILRMVSSHIGLTQSAKSVSRVRLHHFLHTSVLLVIHQSFSLFEHSRFQKMPQG